MKAGRRGDRATAYAPSTMNRLQRQRTRSLAIHGPVSATSDQIAPGDATTIKVQMKTGSYEASVDGIAARPFSFTVGPERPSGANQLLLP